MKVNDLVKLKEKIKLIDGKILDTDAVGLIIAKTKHCKDTLYKVYIPLAENKSCRGYYFTEKHIEVLSDSK